ncbi:MAG TPA: hypothetical protein VKX17_02575 [Planctomycetota bacterium]|nr:hypothetical protein [Planctomycetota bacterium]
MSEKGGMNEPLVAGVGNFIAWSLITLWIASYWASGQTLWLIALGTGAAFGLIMFALKTQEVAVRKKKESRRDLPPPLFNRVPAAAPPAMSEPLPELSAADMGLVEKLVQSYPGYLPRREGVVREVGRELNSRGGMKLMLAAHDAVRNRLGGVAARELEVAWDGIGEWMG